MRTERSSAGADRLEGESYAVDDPVRDIADRVEEDRAAQIEGQRRGQPSIYTCPDCSGTLWQMNEPELVVFRCHVGHIVTAEMLLEQQSEAAENALWLAIRTLSDKMVLGRQLANFARKEGNEAAAAIWDEQSRLAERKSQALRHLAENSGPSEETMAE